jgi:hypothetical protein
VTWGLISSRQYITNSLYKFMTNGGMNSNMASKIWKCKIPLKVRIFLWQTFQDRLQTGQQLNARNWKGRGSCCLCGKMNNVDHLLLECSMAMFIWSFLGEALRWEGYPRNMDDLKSNWLTQGFGVSYQTGLACFIEFTWVIWNTRTKMIMQDVFPDKPINVLFLGVSFIQKWCPLMRKLEKDPVKAMVKAL